MAASATEDINANICHKLMIIKFFWMTIAFIVGTLVYFLSKNNVTCLEIKYDECFILRPVFFHLADSSSSTTTVSPQASFPFCITKESIKIIILNYNLVLSTFLFKKVSFLLCFYSIMYRAVRIRSILRGWMWRGISKHPEYFYGVL